MADRNRRRRNRRRRRRERRGGGFETGGDLVQEGPSVDERVKQEIDAGREFGAGLEQEFLSPEAVAAARTAEEQELIDLRRARLDGLTPEELLNFREEGLRDIDREFAGASRRLAASGLGRVRGGAAAGRVGALLGQQLGQRAELEGDLRRLQTERREAALGALEQTLGATLEAQRQRQQDALQTVLGGIGARTSLAGGFRGEDLARDAQQQALDESRRARRSERRLARQFERQSAGLF